MYTEWNIGEEILGNMRAAVCLTRIKIWQHGKRIEKENKKSKMTLRDYGLSNETNKPNTKNEKCFEKTAEELLGEYYET